MISNPLQPMPEHIDEAVNRVHEVAFYFLAIFIGKNVLHIHVAANGFVPLTSISPTNRNS
jgi:hypothetical protein